MIQNYDSFGIGRRDSLRYIVAAPLILKGATSSQAQSIQAIEKFLSGLETRLLRTFDVRSELEPARDELVSLMQVDKSVPNTWQLDPQLAKGMAPAELFDYVESRARMSLICVSDLLTGTPSDLLDDNAINAYNLKGLYWDKPLPNNKVRISADCSTLVDSNNIPISLITFSDLHQYRMLADGFKREAAEIATQRKVGQGAIFERFIRYANKKHPKTPQELEEITSLGSSIGLPQDAKVFQARVFNFLAVVAYNGKSEPKLIYLAPFIW